MKAANEVDYQRALGKPLRLPSKKSPHPSRRCTAMTSSRSNLEGDYHRAFLARASIQFIPQGIQFFRRNVGSFKLDEDRFFRSSIPGQCDLYGIGRGGRHYEIEVKRFTKIKECRGIETESHKKKECAQAHWRDWCRAWQVPWLLLEVHKTEVPPVTIARWLAECAAWMRVAGQGG